MCEEVGRRGATWGDVAEVGQCKAGEGKARWRMAVGRPTSTMPRRYMSLEGLIKSRRSHRRCLSLRCVRLDLALGVEWRIRSSS